MPKTSQLQKTLCHDCGRINIGYQTECLVCNGQLIASRKPGSKKTETIKDTEVTGDTGVVSSVCSSCGEQLASDQFFCTNCGTKKEEEVFLPVNHVEQVSRRISCFARHAERVCSNLSILGYVFLYYLQ